MNEYSFASPASVRALTVPVGELKRSQFQEFLGVLTKVKEVRLMDLTPNPGLFNPQAYPSGRLIYNFGPNNIDTDTLFLHDFEPFRKTLIVVGLMQWTDKLDDIKFNDLTDDLKKRYPNAVSHFLIVFESGDSSTTDVDRVYLVKKDASDMLTALCDLSSRFLTEFATYSSSYQHVTLRSPGSITGNNSTLKPSRSLMEKQRRRISGSFEMSIEKANKFKASGRRLKLYADFYLLSGNLKNAMSNFCEAIFYLKSANDYLWLASALDGLSVSIFLLAFVDAPFQLPGFVSSLLDNVRESSVLSSFTPPASPRPSLQLPASISSSIQSATSVQLSPLPFSSISELLHKTCMKAFEYYRLSILNGDDYVPQIVFYESNMRYMQLFAAICVERELNRSVINYSVYGVPLTNSQISEDNDFDHDQFSQLFSGIFGDGFREVPAAHKCSIYNFMISVCHMLRLKRKKSLLIGGFIDLLLSSNLQSYRVRYVDSNIGELLDSHCEVYGIGTTHGPSISDRPNTLQKRTLLQVSAFSEAVGYFEGVVKYGSILLSDFHTLLADSEQQRIYKEVRDAMSKCEVQIQYWDQQLLQDIEFHNDPQDYLVQNELADAYITVRNPFAFEVEIADLLVSTEDDFSLTTQVNSRRQNLISVQHNVPILLRAKSTVSIPVFLIPNSYGKLRMNGVTATVCGCERQTFVSLQEEDVAFPKCKSTSAQTSLSALKEVREPKPKIWEVSVVYEQPLLKLMEIKLSNKWILMLEGECKKFVITLKNYSHIEINNMVSTFVDSTIEPLNQLLNNKSLPPNEVYEIEYYLTKKKPFKILNKMDMQKIKGKSDFNLEMEIWGKRGVKQAQLILEYSHKRQNSDTYPDFTRSITIPVNVTVYPSVELVGCDIIPLSSLTKVSSNNRGDCWVYLERMVLKGYRMSDFCLLALDFLNSWTEEMEVRVQSLLSGSTSPDFQEQNGPILTLPDDAFDTKLGLRSKKSVRVLIPIQRMNFTDEHLNGRIPSLRNKQFIYDSKTPIAEQTFIKHAFWYRDELLKRVRACWKIPGDVENSVYAGRSGTIDLRSIRFSSKMVNILKIEKIGIILSLLDTNGEMTEREDVKLNTFYTLRVKLVNRSDVGVFGMLRHIPVCKSPGTPLEKKILFNGVLQSTIGRELKAGESRNFDLGIVFLEKGEYEWGALLDEMDESTGKLAIKEQYLQREQLKLKVC
ncbi:DEKNAAC103457 [Brettanomyces naardenensis]|uniref:DEKNAAC103457 n=1 Tax=Brettanomyces naardenensis TaxID=13370 RepID=A0A448YNK3_BRENA|nr:DEKNAAC103457 [Brettanomyces naardenensis]